MTDVTDLERRLADELEHARHMLVEMGDELSMNEEVVAEHGVALQAVDIVGQMLGHIANVVRAADRIVLPGVGHFFHGQLSLLKNIVVHALQRPTI